MNTAIIIAATLPTIMGALLILKRRKEQESAE